MYKDKLFTHLRELFSAGDLLEYRHLLLAAKEKQISLNISQLGELFKIENGERVYGNIIDLTKPLSEIDEKTSEHLCKLLKI